MDGKFIRFVRASAILVLTCFSFEETSSAQDSSTPLTFVAIGDSITTAFNAEHWLDNFGWSWATGASSAVGFASQASRLEAASARPIERLNFAVAGSRALELLRQVEKIEDRRPDYATVLIGANDICSWPVDHEEALVAFERDVHAALDALIARNPEVRIALVPVPNMGRLYELGSAHGCQFAWNVTGLCSALLGGERTPAERQAFLERFADLTRSIVQVGSAHPANVRVYGELAEVRFEWQHLSRIDCFHPSVAGQGFIAEKLWETDWWQQP